jgi:hypothetical protein
MTDTEETGPDPRPSQKAIRGYVEIAAAYLLAIATIATAYCAWQATRWGGYQTLLFAEASTARVESAKMLSIGNMEMSYDALSFLMYAEAFTEENETLIKAYEERLLRDEFKVAVDAWRALDPLNNPDAPSHPLQMDEYVNSSLAEGQSLEAAAGEKFEEGKAANQTADNYILATVFFASVLFFAGVANKFENVWIQVTSIALALVVLGVGFVRVVTLPFM